jgi:hypothetical protein
MFGLMGAQLLRQVGAAPTSNELVMDPEIDNPVLWSNEGPFGQGSIVAGGEIFSLNDDATIPTAGPLKTGVRLEIGASYRCRVQVLSDHTMLFRVRVLDIDTSDAQMVIQTSDMEQLVDVTFEATVSATHVEFLFFDTGMRIGSVSIQPVAA